jgi:hypothetical protein
MVKEDVSPTRLYKIEMPGGVVVGASPAKQIDAQLPIREMISLLSIEGVMSKSQK